MQRIDLKVKNYNVTSTIDKQKFLETREIILPFLVIFPIFPFLEQLRFTNT